MEILHIITLALSGLLLLMVGAMRTLTPIKAFKNGSGITLPNKVNLLNEVRGIGALMFFSGLIISLGIFIPELTFSSHLIGALVFLGFVMGRILSIAKDGKPNKQILSGIVFELVLGGLNLLAVFT